jgi:hypothetical protein
LKKVDLSFEEKPAVHRLIEVERFRLA